MTPRAPLLPMLAVAVCGCVWGLYWLPVRWFDGQGIGGAWVSLVFNAVAGVAVLPWLARRGAWAGFAGHLPTGLLLGTAFALYTFSLVLTDVLHAILLFYLTPVWSTLAAWLLFGQRLDGARVAAIALGFAGMALILGATSGLPLPRNVGDWLTLVSGMLWSAGSLRSFRRPAPGIAIPVMGFALGGVLASAVALAVGAVWGLPLAAPGGIGGALPAMVGLAMLVFVPPNVLVLWAAQRVDPGRVGILLTTEVVVGAVGAALWSGEPFEGADLAGTVLIMAAGLTEVLGRRVSAGSG